MTSFLLDPSVLFTMIVVLLPIILELNSPNLIELIQSYLLAPPFLICFTLILILEFKAPSTSQLTRSEYRVSRWYLMNGLIYHSLMDPITGFMQNWSLMTKQYNYLDQRFAAPFDVGAETATLTVWMEGAMMCPGCIFLFIGYRYMLPKMRDKSDKDSSRANIVWIYCLEFVVGLCQSIGTYFFYGAEFMLLITGQDTNMPYARNIKDLDLDVWECFYFWFGTYAMVWVWIVVPFICMTRSYGQLVDLVLDNKPNKD